MKVKDLIAELQKCDAEAVVQYESECRWFEVHRVDKSLSDQYNDYTEEARTQYGIKNIVEIH